MADYRRPFGIKLSLSQTQGVGLGAAICVEWPGISTGENMGYRDLPTPGFVFCEKAAIRLTDVIAVMYSKGIGNWIIFFRNGKEQVCSEDIAKLVMEGLASG